ncbi:MAG: mechanosensitive ion channel family protein [Clostridiales bacterium]|nr:mechanosensitive ion channel family protein [Clostridiales bacterium]
MKELDSLKNIQLGSISLEQLALALIVLAVCLIVMRFIMGAIKRNIEKMPIERSMHGFIYSIARALLYFLIVIIVAGTLGIPVTSLIALLSLAGLAISLAAQNLLANVAGGLLILSAKPFVTGDYIEAAGVSGTVTSIGLAYTKIKTPDNKIIYAPNREISGEKITNHSAESLRRVDINVGASYNSSINEVKTALHATLAGQPAVLTEPAPSINVLSYDESCIRYALRAWVRTEDYGQVYAALMEDIRDCFEAQGVQMTYNHLNIHMIDAAANNRS